MYLCHFPFSFCPTDLFYLLTSLRKFITSFNDCINCTRLIYIYPEIGKCCLYIRVFMDLQWLLNNQIWVSYLGKIYSHSLNSHHLSELLYLGLVYPEICIFHASLSAGIGIFESHVVSHILRYL